MPRSVKVGGRLYQYVRDIKNHVGRTAYPQSFIPRCLSRNWKALGSDCSWIQRMVQLQAPGNHQNRQANIIWAARSILLFRPKNKCANNDQSRTLFSLSRHDASNSKLKLLTLSTYFMPHTHKMKVTRHEACGHFRFWTEDIWELGCKGNCITTDCLRDILFFSFPLFSFTGRTACVTRFSVRC